MKKMKLNTSNIMNKNFEKLVNIFPNCLTEAHDESGEIQKVLDFDKLRQELSPYIVEGIRERYSLDWPGKRKALLNANASVAKTLRPNRKESEDFDTTKNLFIEGDNLDALKLLQESYLNKVNMIYIDPPYNTGNQHIYEDNFTGDIEIYLRASNQKDEFGNRMVANTESNGRRHSDWLSMIYPRLKLSRNLLCDTGIIFISIDNHEQANLKKICDEIFGPDNFRGMISRETGTPSGQGYGILVNEIDYVLVYAKSSEATLLGLPFSEDDLRKYDKKDCNGRYLTRPLRKTGGEDRRQDRPTMYYGIESPNGEYIFPIGPGGYESRWRCSKDTYEELKSNGMIEWVESEDNNSKTWKPYQKFYSEGRTKQPSNLWKVLDIEGNKKASLDVKNLFGAKVFDSPKPVGFLKRCISIATSKNDLVLDFFAGSSTTAHAILALNADESSNRRFIMVQLPEDCSENSEAFRAGFKNIAEISKERIRRAGKKIKEENLITASDLDIGFRVLKVDASNMANVHYSPDHTNQSELFENTDNIKEDRTPEDLLFQVLLDWGVDLTLPITKETIDNRDVFYVDDNALAACFEKNGNITEDFCKELARRQPLRVVFRDSGFKNDSVKINVEQIFKLMSPHTDLKTV
jgi:adenine-specific DNA-methyltransferase